MNVSDVKNLPTKLFNKDFILLFSGRIVSSLGNAIYYIAMMWWIVQKFSSSQAGMIMGAMFVFDILPTIVIGPFSGVLADRMSRKTLVVLSDGTRGALMLWLAYLAHADSLSVLWIYTIAFCMGTGSAFFSPALRATLPNVVPRDHLTKANSLYGVGIQVTQMIGPALGGFLIAFFGVPFVFALNGVSFIISAFTEIFINFRQGLKERSHRKPTKFMSDLKEGLKFLYEQKTLFWFVIVFSLINFAGAPIDIVLTKQVKDVLRLGAMELGYIGSSFAGGMITGGLIFSMLPELKKKHNVIAITSLASGLLLSILGIVPYISLLIVAFAIGMCMAVINVLGSVVEQRITPNEKRGRVFGVISTLSTALMPISYALIGTISVMLSNAVIFLLLGLMIIAMSLFLYAVPGISEI